MDTADELLAQCCAYPADQAARHLLAPNGIDVYAVNRSVIRPGQNVTVLVVPVSEDNSILDHRFVAEVQRISFRGCYCSVFDTCWITNFATLRPRQVAQCPVEPRAFNRPSP